MNQTLEEIKKLAKEYQAASLGRNPLATNCLRMIEALEKCREQRDYFGRKCHDGWPNPESVYLSGHEDKELTAILEGK